MISSDEPAAAALLARLDRIPVWPYGRRLLGVIGAGYFFAYFDVVTIGLALPVIADQFDVSNKTAALAVTSSLMGYIVGALLDSRIADTRGRRVSMMISVCLFTGGTAAAAFSPGMVWLVVFRFVAGMGIGAEIAAVTTYVGELAPASVRGRATSLVAVMAFAGLAVVPIAARVLVPSFDDGWRVLFLVGAAGGLTIAFLRRELPPSVRWLLSRGRITEAEDAVAKAEARAREILGAELPEPEAPEPAGVSGVESGTGRLFSPPYLWRLLLFIAVWGVYYVGNYGWLTLAPTLLTEHGYSLSSSLSFLIVTGTGYVVGAVISTRLADRLERRRTTSLAALAWAVSLLGIGFVPGAAAIMGFGFLASVTIGFLIPLLYTYTAEHFPTSCRATGVAMTDGLGHLGGALAPTVVLAAADAWGFSGAFTVMAATGLAVGALLLLGRRTAGLTLTAR